MTERAKEMRAARRKTSFALWNGVILLHRFVALGDVVVGEWLIVCVPGCCLLFETENSGG